MRSQLFKNRVLWVVLAVVLLHLAANAQTIQNTQGLTSYKFVQAMAAATAMTSFGGL